MIDISVLFYASLISHVIEDSGEIILSHLLTVESPELLLVLIRVIRGVLATVSVTTRVTKPNIITSSSSYESRGNFRVVHRPAVRRIENTMLQQNSRLAQLLGFSSESRNTPDGQNVTIFGSYCVLFKTESIFDSKLLESSLSISCRIPGSRVSSYKSSS